GRRESDDQPVRATRQGALIDIAHTEAVVVGTLLQHLEDRVPQVLVAVARREFQEAVIELERRAVGEAIEIKVPLLAAGEVAGIRLARVGLELRLRERAR